MAKRWVTTAGSASFGTSPAAVIDNFTDDLETQTGQTELAWTILRMIGHITLMVPAATAAGRAYQANLAIGMIDGDAAAAGAVPEPGTDEIQWIWTWNVTVHADHTVPASYAAPAVPWHLSTPYLDIRPNRKTRGLRQQLVLTGTHDNGLGTNPSLKWNFRNLYNIR